MSSLPGGAADKGGLNHEAYWGISGMLDVLRSKFTSICIEEPGVDGAEFFLEQNSTREYWQAKRQVLSQANWSLQLLKSNGVLDFFLERARIGTRCVFASISDAPELRVLSENASEANSWETFQDHFLKSKDRKEEFNELRKHWNDLPEKEAYGFLQFIRVEGARECTLDAQLSRVIQATFTGPPQTAISVLYHLYMASVHKTLTTNDILKHLEKYGIKPREFPIAAGLQDFLLGVTDTYIAGQRSKLIEQKLIPRQVAFDILARIAASDQSLDFLLAGSAGSGKSASLFQIVEGLRIVGVPVLAFRLDRIEPVSSTEALGKKLELPESPAVVLSRCFEGQPTVLVVDQLDFVSATSGRHPDFFDTLAALVNEVRGLRSSHRIHLVLACRQFDFENDHRFRSLLSSEHKPFTVALLTDLEVKSVIDTNQGDSTRLSTRQLELLRLPQNLALFIDAGLAKETAPAFVSQKELFDAYWDTKRRAVSLQRPNEAALWNSVLEKLTNTMSAKQELSVPKSRLDEFPPELLGAMASQGVLTFDGSRYGFGHESFFDYCFARNIAAKEREFLDILEEDEQQLFRRAQLRQVLVYLRDDDIQRYVTTVTKILESKKIRSHLKLLVLELIAAFPNPYDEEFNIILPLLESELNCYRNKKPNPNKIASRAFSTFLSSRSLFLAADRLGYVEKWLYSGENCIEDQMTDYLRWQVDAHADRVAALLEPLVGKSEAWRKRLSFIMRFGNLEKGRRFFELFLKLLDDGSLDDARSLIATNGTFWSMLSLLPKVRPDWYTELAGHWLDRKVKIALSSEETKGGFYLHDEFGVEGLFESARNAPDAFLKHVLPAILRAAQTFSQKGENVFSVDGVWDTPYHGQHIGLADSYLSCCGEAFSILSNSDPNLLRPFIDDLRNKELYIANHLLLNLYLTAPVTFAEEAADLLSSEPDRLLCGFTSNAHWVSRRLIEMISSHCSEKAFRRLETILIDYSTPYERALTDDEQKGHAAYNLVSALAPSRLGAHAAEKLKQWEKVFLAPDGLPKEGGCFSVESPVGKVVAEGFSDDDWFHNIAKYHSGWAPDWNHPGRGGADSFAAILPEFVKKEPERFARLALRLPVGTRSSYFMNILYGLREATLSGDLKCAVVRLIFNSECKACLMAGLDLLSEITDTTLPDDAIQFIEAMATKHPDPAPMAKDTTTYGKKPDIRIDGRNSVRGHAALAIHSLVYHDKKYLAIFQKAIDGLASDPSLAVRACAASTLMAVAYHDTPRALVLFLKLVEINESLFATGYVQEFIRRGLNKHLPDLRQCIERMLASSDPEVSNAGGRYAVLARLYHPEAEDLANAAVNGKASCRLGAVTVAKDNFLNPNCRTWCEAKLQHFFFDQEADVRRVAANCFWYLWQAPDMPLSEFNSLIQAFLSSPAFADEPTFLLHTLNDTRQRVPNAILDVCEHFVAKCAEQARDIRTALAADEYTVGKLVFRAYAQLEATEARKRALNLIDQMCEEGLQSTRQYFSEFER